MIITIPIFVYAALEGRCLYRNILPAECRNRKIINDYCKQRIKISKMGRVINKKFTDNRHSPLSIYTDAYFITVILLKVIFTVDQCRDIYRI